MVKNNNIQTRIFFLLIIALFFSNCKEKITKPSLKTLPVNNVTSNSVQSGGEITDDGGTIITSRGVVWGYEPNLTLENYDGIVVSDSESFVFTSDVVRLTRYTKYYIRSFAQNSEGVGYGNEIEFTTEGEPISIITSDVMSIKDTSAISGGVIADDGGSAIISRGVVWDYTEEPTVESNQGMTNDGEGTGEFVSELKGLIGNKDYYIRAYATNSIGTYYGQTLIFATPGLVDIDGNAYKSVVIGNQEWMAENLKTTRYSNGNSIPNVVGISNWASLGVNYKAYCWYSDYSVYGQQYGALYTWAAAMNGAASSSSNPSGIQGVCPTGWHLPSDEEWKVLEQCLGLSEGEANQIGLRGSNEGGKLKEIETEHWNFPNTDATNESGFTALGSGYRGGTGYFDPIGNGGFWWSATEAESSSPYYRAVYYNNGQINRNNLTSKIGFSVRCVKD